MRIQITGLVSKTMFQRSYITTSPFLGKGPTSASSQRTVDIRRMTSFSQRPEGIEYCVGHIHKDHVQIESRRSSRGLRRTTRRKRPITGTYIYGSSIRKMLPLFQVHMRWLSWHERVISAVSRRLHRLPYITDETLDVAELVS